jgi:predicted nucleic acid-binding protein
VKLLLDINVLLDVLLDREPWSEAASALLSMIESEAAEAFVAPHTLPTIHYIVARARDRKVAVAAVTDLLRIVEVATLTKTDFQEALAVGIPDFEDAVQTTAALRIGADYLVTRNDKDFRESPVPIADPATILALL